MREYAARLPGRVVYLGQVAHAQARPAAAPHVPLSLNEELLAPPSELRLPTTTVSAAVADQPNRDGSVNVSVSRRAASCSSAISPPHLPYLSLGAAEEELPYISLYPPKSP